MEGASFDWQRHAEGEKFCLDLLAEFTRTNTTLARLERKICQETSGRLLDWVDHLRTVGSPEVEEKLAACGFVRDERTPEMWRHPGAVLPRFVLGSRESGVALRVESIADFLQVHNFAADIEGGALTAYRQAIFDRQNEVALLAVERRGGGGIPEGASEKHLGNYLAGVELWRTRPRAGVEEDVALAEAFRRVDELVDLVGTELAAHVVCEGERHYWLSRNFAGRVQQSRQNALGLGWGNHDHHTFRSSRRNFARLVELFSRLGFHHRERFYAGEEAGWGAQLMENTAAGLTLFLDVDLAPEEVATDFAREELPEREELGTVGLWCALHGDSILGAGMHHLAAQFDFGRLAGDVAAQGVSFMPPFSDFPYLKQAFSIAERWEVDPQKVERLVREGTLGSEQGERFLAQGAIGSHLENIERREGYKGFNKKNVSLIIRETDPRRVSG